VAYGHRRECLGLAVYGAAILLCCGTNITPSLRV
jgi:hypothetical protein